MGRSYLSYKPADFQVQVKEAPLLPGCYIYRNKHSKIIYIGKAKVLRNRVRSYFSNYKRLEPKIASMIKLAQNVEFMVTDSEVEALILESVLIKKYKPKYNSMGVDDKSYAYVEFDSISTSKGEFISIPTITVTREPTKSGEYFGPYPDSRTVKRLLRKLRRIFPYCTSSNKVIIPTNRQEKVIAKNPRPCFQSQIGLCPGTCASLVTRAELEQNHKRIKQFFQGQKQDLLNEFESQMRSAAKARDYEQAAKLRNMINDIKYVGSNLHIGKDIDEVAIMQTKQARREQSVAQLIQELDFPQNKLQLQAGIRIECYDISNIQGKFAVGSMVVFVDGQADPSQYRRFRIKAPSEPNDFAMLQEVLSRRFARFARLNKNHQIASQMSLDTYTDIEGFSPASKSITGADESFSQIPDLIIIDGGKGQLSSCFRILSKFGLADKIPIVGLAKREEEIFKISHQFPDPYAPQRFSSPRIDEFASIRLPKRSEALYLVQRIRDEAHRFGITYHRHLRSKAFTKT